MRAQLQKALLMFDYLVVGAGFAGAVTAERMARVHGKKVLVVDRRKHVGGNAYDHLNDDGVLIHRYGPHIFHTNSEQVFHYLSQFTSWRCYEHRVLASVDGKLVPIPINLDTVNLLYGLQLETEEEVEAFFASRAEPRAQIKTSEDAVVSKVGRDLYEKMFRNYTRKQWGKDPSELDAQVTARIPVRTNRDDRYFGDRYQAMPKNGYTRMFENMLDHPNITLELDADYRDVLPSVKYREMIYSGPVDEFFGYRYGKLPYRSLRFQHETVNTEFFQPVAVVNYPNEHAYTRITEFKHLTGQAHSQTSVVYEFPSNTGDPYYPVPTPANGALYKRYSDLAAKEQGVHFVGRLATYKYYNMDQVVAQALTLCKQLASAPAFTEVKRSAAAAVGQPLTPLPAAFLS
jgi:UDP-galactopyranose mutase